MPALKQYQLFISHSWGNDEYNRLINLLDSAKYLHYFDYSVNKEEPLNTRLTHGLRNGLRNQIMHANVVLILAGMYVNYSRAIIDEIQIAVEYNKPIIGIVPYGNTNIPMAIRRVADTIVGWRTDSIVEAIRKYAK